MGVPGISDYHFVMVLKHASVIELSGLSSKSAILQQLSKEQALELQIFKRCMEILKKRNFLGFLDSGTKDFHLK